MIGTHRIALLAAVVLVSAVSLCPSRCLGASMVTALPCHHHDSSPGGSPPVVTCCPILASVECASPPLSRVDVVSAAPLPAAVAEPVGALQPIAVRQAARRASPPRPLYLHTLALLI
jgi:hypothetical protein